jgi:YD repeat-containing protein
MNTIQLTQEQMDNLQSGKPITIEPPTAKPVWGPEGGNYFASAEGDIKEGCSKLGFREFGTERATHSQAELASEAMRTFNRLLAYRDEFDTDYVFSYDEANYYVTQTHAGRWTTTWTRESYSPTVVYMSKTAAIALVRKLNSGEVTL